jgi:mRNA-degrading endonuclease RelE of RelBE toxin-antitoxin system
MVLLYKIHATEIFEKKFKKIIPDNKKADTKRRIEKLKLNPYIGKPLGSNFFRELKLDKFRIYYEIYDEEVVILLISISNKKQQHDTIEYIQSKREELRNCIKNLKENELI